MTVVVVIVGGKAGSRWRYAARKVGTDPWGGCSAGGIDRRVASDICPMSLQRIAATWGVLEVRCDFSAGLGSIAGFFHRGGRSRVITHADISKSWPHAPGRVVVPACGLRPLTALPWSCKPISGRNPNPPTVGRRCDGCMGGFGKVQSAVHGGYSRGIPSGAGEGFPWLLRAGTEGRLYLEKGIYMVDIYSGWHTYTYTQTCFPSAITRNDSEY